MTPAQSSTKRLELTGVVVEEAVMVGGGGLNLDALEAMQAMLERRKGGETGVKAVQMLEGDDVWEARRLGVGRIH